MPLSGSINFSMTAEQLITSALRTMGVLRAGQGASIDQMAVGVEALNILIKSLQTRGLNLHALQKTFLFLEKNKQRYELSSTGDHWTTAFSSTQLFVTGVATDTTITVDSATSISDADQIGIQLDNGTMHWTTVNGAPVGNVVTITAALPSDAAINLDIYNYTTKAHRPMQVDRVVVSDTNDTDIPVSMISLEEYSYLTPKDTEGVVTHVYFDPQRITSFATVWPTTNDVTDYLTVWVQRTLEDIDTSADDIDFPHEWYKALRYQLAADLCPEFPEAVPSGKWKNLVILAEKYIDEAEFYDNAGGFDLQPASENNQD